MFNTHSVISVCFKFLPITINLSTSILDLAHHRTLNAFMGTINLTMCNEVLYDLYSSLTIIKVIKSGKRWDEWGMWNVMGERCTKGFGGET
jgi:hypothetical protein